MKTVDIPGGTAVFREGRGELRGRDMMLIKAAGIAAGPALRKLATEDGPDDETPEERTRRVDASFANAQLSLGEGMALLQMRQAIVVATLKSWTLREPLPTMDTIGDLDPDLYDALDEAIGGIPAALEAATDFGPDPDQESPTTPSGGSGGHLRAKSKRSTRTRENAGASTATESSTTA